MRRVVAGLALVLGLLGVAVTAGTIWVLTDDCGLLCSDTVTSAPSEVTDLAAADLGFPLPPGVTPVAAREGGFQDRFIQIRLAASDAGLDALLASFGHARADMDITTTYLGPPGPAWWPGPVTGPTIALTAPRLDFLTLAAEPAAPGQWHLYVWGFDT